MTTVASTPAQPMSAEQTTRALIDRKEAIQTELDAQFAILSENKSTMNTPLVDAEGFPRADIDVFAVRHARVKVIQLRNDMNDIVDRIGKGLQSIYVPQPRQQTRPVPTETQQQQTEAKEHPLFLAKAGEDSSIQLAPFAVVDLVSPGSPAATAGLLKDDVLVQFGNLTKASFTTSSLQPIAELLQDSENRPLTVRVNRNQERVTLTLTPQIWSGRGLLGCHVVPFKASTPASVPVPVQQVQPQPDSTTREHPLFLTRAGDDMSVDLAPFARVEVVVANGPASQAGLQKGDVVTQFGHLTKASFSYHSLRPIDELVEESENRPIIVKVNRGEQHRISFTILPRNGTIGCQLVDSSTPAPAPAVAREPIEHPLFVAGAGDDSSIEYRPFARVTSVAPGSPAADAGIQSGDVILQFGHLTRSSFTVNSLQPINEFVDESENRPFAVRLQREGSQGRLSVTLTPRSGWGGEGLTGISFASI